MPHRKSPKKLIDPKLIVGILIALSALWLVVEVLSHASFSLMLVVILVGVPAAVFWRRARIRASLIRKTQMIVWQQISPLVRRRAQLVWTDAYGMPQVEKWEKEKHRFIAQLIEPCLDRGERAALHREPQTVAGLIEMHVNAAAESQPAYRDFFDHMSPAEFELFCAEQLRHAGWSARVTRQSHDQGVDVVAEKNGIRVVVQCKLYTQPVGNKAVQEIATAKAHEQAQYGVVVTNNRYTSAAEQLASTNRILLLHYSQLQNLESLLSNDLAIK
ncbi:MAG TPA: restriction endonuclease [Ktedonobacteraceae bacterium]